MGVNYDFSGYVTKNDLKCSDGRTIRKGAFKGCDGKKVPLVYQHQHFDIDNVLGHMILEEREDGVYGKGYFNDTEKALKAKAQVNHGDLTHLSIYANQLKQDHGDVLHGVIREVSLVLAGANPGAVIDFPIIAHSGEMVEDEGVFYLPDDISISHAEEEKKEPEEKEPEKKEEDGKEESKETIQQIFDSMNEKQKKVTYFMIGQAMKDAKTGNDTKVHEHSYCYHGRQRKNGIYHRPSYHFKQRYDACWLYRQKRTAAISQLS